MDFYNSIAMNHLSKITNKLMFSSIKHFEIIWFGESAVRGTGLNKL